jgi:hypothetical protein
MPARKGRSYLFNLADTDIDMGAMTLILQDASKAMVAGDISVALADLKACRHWLEYRLPATSGPGGLSATTRRSFRM